MDSFLLHGTQFALWSWKSWPKPPQRFFWCSDRKTKQNDCVDLLWCALFALGLPPASIRLMHPEFWTSTTQRPIYEPGIKCTNRIQPVTDAEWTTKFKHLSAIVVKVKRNMVQLTKQVNHQLDHYFLIERAAALAIRNPAQSLNNRHCVFSMLLWERNNTNAGACGFASLTLNPSAFLTVLSSHFQVLFPRQWSTLMVRADKVSSNDSKLFFAWNWMEYHGEWLVSTLARMNAQHLWRPALSWAKGQRHPKVVKRWELLPLCCFTPFSGISRPLLNFFTTFCLGIRLLSKTWIILVGSQTVDMLDVQFSTT